MIFGIWKKNIFIALIHPIQWTIANPVGADRPAKRQKKMSCVSTGRPVPSTVHSQGGASYLIPSCLDRVTSWHLFCLARVLCRCVFNNLQIFYGKAWIMTDFSPYWHIIYCKSVTYISSTDTHLEICWKRPLVGSIWC